MLDRAIGINNGLPTRGRFIASAATPGKLLSPTRAPRFGAGKVRAGAQGLFDAQRLVPLRHALGARDRTDLELKRAPADREMAGLLRRYHKCDPDRGCGVNRRRTRARTHKFGFVGAAR
jgi:hypothetical protein